MSASGGTKAVMAALLANAGIAVSKFVAFLFTGSSSMLAESIHSVADAGNQGLLLLGGRKAKRAPSEEHPFGYGRERYIYAFIVSVVLFTVGGLFALYEGYHKIEESREGHHSLDAPLVAVIVLVVAIALEIFSFRTAIVESNKVRGSQSWVTFIRRAKAPELPVVLLEDLAALLGLIFALIGVSVAWVTDDVLYDGIGTLAIGALLVVVAITLAIETKSLLLGESAGPESVARIRAALEQDSVERVIHLRTMHLGPDELLVAAKIAVPAGSSAVEVAEAINAAEHRVRAAEPLARMIFLEPDIYSAEDAARGSDLPPVHGSTAGH